MLRKPAILLKNHAADLLDYTARHSAKNLASLLAAMGHAGLAVERLRPALLRLRLPMGEGGVDAVHGANCRPQAKWSIPTGC